jgi:hypothetical protein
MFMQNMLSQAASIKTDSKIVLPFAKDLPVALIDARDIAAVGARILGSFRYRDRPSYRQAPGLARGGPSGIPSATDAYQ